MSKFPIPKPSAIKSQLTTIPSASSQFSDNSVEVSQLNSHMLLGEEESEISQLSEIEPSLPNLSQIETPVNEANTQSQNEKMEIDDPELSKQQPLEDCQNMFNNDELEFDKEKEEGDQEDEQFDESLDIDRHVQRFSPISPDSTLDNQTQRSLFRKDVMLTQVSSIKSFGDELSHLTQNRSKQREDNKLDTNQEQQEETEDQSNQQRHDQKSNANMMQINCNANDENSLDILLNDKIDKEMKHSLDQTLTDSLEDSLPPQAKHTPNQAKREKKRQQKQADKSQKDNNQACENQDNQAQAQSKNSGSSSKSQTNTPAKGKIIMEINPDKTPKKRKKRGQKYIGLIIKNKGQSVVECQQKPESTIKQSNDSQKRSRGRKSRSVSQAHLIFEIQRVKKRQNPAIPTNILSEKVKSEMKQDQSDYTTQSEVDQNTVEQSTERQLTTNTAQPSQQRQVQTETQKSHSHLYQTCQDDDQHSKSPSLSQLLSQAAAAHDIKSYLTNNSNRKSSQQNQTQQNAINKAVEVESKEAGEAMQINQDSEELQSEVNDVSNDDMEDDQNDSNEEQANKITTTVQSDQKQNVNHSIINETQASVKSIKRGRVQRSQTQDLKMSEKQTQPTYIKVENAEYPTSHLVYSKTTLQPKDISRQLKRIKKCFCMAIEGLIEVQKCVVQNTIQYEGRDQLFVDLTKCANADFRGIQESIISTSASKSLSLQRNTGKTPLQLQLVQPKRRGRPPKNGNSQGHLQIDTNQGFNNLVLDEQIIKNTQIESAFQEVLNNQNQQQIHQLQPQMSNYPAMAYQRQIRRGRKGRPPRRSHLSQQITTQPSISDGNNLLLNQHNPYYYYAGNTQHNPFCGLMIGGMIDESQQLNSSAVANLQQQLGIQMGIDISHMININANNDLRNNNNGLI
ncbi:UNKNOWN [Stylonychia lemnae]|uniref:Uncharacterized protein n=1 Tax=Stylonychia lemnae TaxID=5949 RepID=A0A078ANX3_STYLE|nr:UNKNOWN [Stylonychia lemnae]|eukprot:CDW83007.1 UNKNOWN [Stylonychia lemnae]